MHPPSEGAKGAIEIGVEFRGNVAGRPDNGDFGVGPTAFEIGGVGSRRTDVSAGHKAGDVPAVKSAGSGVGVMGGGNVIPVGVEDDGMRNVGFPAVDDGGSPGVTRSGAGFAGFVSHGD